LQIADLTRNTRDFERKADKTNICRNMTINNLTVSMPRLRAAVLVVLAWNIATPVSVAYTTSLAFTARLAWQTTPAALICSARRRGGGTPRFMIDNGMGGNDNYNNGDADDVDPDGVDLAAQFFNTIKSRPDIERLLDDVDDLEEMYDDEDDDIDAFSARSGGSSEDEDQDIPISRVNVFRGRDEGKVGKLAGNTTFTNKELYDNIKERVLESPKAFVDYVGGEDAVDEMELSSMERGKYTPPSLIPDSELTAGEVVELVLQALNNNSEGPPGTSNYGVEVLFAYSSKHSFLKQKPPTVEEYAEFIRESEYAPLFSHTQIIFDKADYSHDRRKAFYNVRINTYSDHGISLTGEVVGGVVQAVGL
jgi:hypothetical protein